MTGDRLNADVDQYLQAAALNTPPPQIVSDPLVTGTTPIEQLLRVLGLAANLSDAQDNAENAEEHARREAALAEAAEAFAAQDAEAAHEMAGIAEYPGPQTAQGNTPFFADQTAMTQQVPQAVSAIAGALSGALGSALQPLSQIPQQVAQGAQQAMQAGIGLLQQGGASGLDDSAASSPDDFTYDPAEFADVGDVGGITGMSGVAPSGGSGGGVPGATAPTSMLGPAPVPSAGTAPSSSPVMRIAPPNSIPTAPPIGPGMAGMPMIPPGAMPGAAGTDKDAKADTRRVSVPTVRNGAPVQGRLFTPPAPVVKKVEGVPVVTRRVTTTGTTTDDIPSSDR